MKLQIFSAKSYTVLSILLRYRVMNADYFIMGKTEHISGIIYS